MKRMKTHMFSVVVDGDFGQSLGEFVLRVSGL